ncbi:VOC family protein [Rhodopseudomonas palustris]|uniref:Glyoxalase-like domain-containing protein n=1 Tax=Rhodopseudomonas palustris (strain BisB18) TaxID=316056 RepID=Q215A9_RHOPB
MPRGLDHIVHAVHDLDAAAALYQRAGFQVGGRNVHPWGTHNRIVQLKDFFIEILSVAEPEKIVPHRPRAFSFGAFQRDFLADRQGLSMLLLQSHDAAADARDFAAAGFGDFDVFDFARDGRRPDGSVAKLAFSLAFAVDPASPEAGFAVCQHHFPENFWNAAFQRHDNGARSVRAAVLVADNPSDHHIFLSTLTGVRDLSSSSIGVAARSPHGDIEIMEPVSFRDQFGLAPAAPGEGARFAGLRIAVDDLDAVERLWQDHGLAFSRRGDRLVLPPQVAFGASLILEPHGPM